MRVALRLAALTVGFLVLGGPAHAQLACKPFMAKPPAAPVEHKHPLAETQFDQIKAAVKTQPYKVLYLGDSITQYWDPKIWAENMAPRGVLNSGVAGDRTEHLRWRLVHGNLAGPPPKGIVLLIGTNDLGSGRPPAEAAEGIRATLLDLRQKLPDTRILLLGLWPRGATADDWYRQQVVETNKLIRTCADDKAIVYADIGGVLLDTNGNLTRELSPDLLHFTAAGYARLTPKLDPLIDRLLGP